MGKKKFWEFIPNYPKYFQLFRREKVHIKLPLQLKSLFTYSEAS